jgi:diguanylate cyclase (GGDEF)-like protein
MRSVRAFVFGLWAAALVLLIWTARFPVVDTWPAVVCRTLLVAVLFACAEIFVVHVKLRRDAHTFSFAEIALVSGLFVVSPLFAVIGAVAGSTLSLAMFRRQRGIKLGFNAAKTAIEMELAFVLFHGFVHRPFPPQLDVLLAAGGSVVVASLAGGALVTVVIALSQGEWNSSALRDIVGLGFVGTIAAVSLGLLAVDVASRDLWAVGLLVAPAVGCFWFYAAFGRERQRTETLQFLYQATRLLHESEALDDALVSLLIEARSTLRARVAELIYRPLTSDNMLYIRIVEGEPPIVSTLEPSPATIALAELTSTSSKAQIIGHGNAQCAQVLAQNGYERALLARLDEDGRSVGAIIAADHVVDVAEFQDEDVRLIETLASALSIALENGVLERMLKHSRILERELEHLAHHDPLTGLANRVRLTERIEELTDLRNEAGQDFAVLFIDLDDFKTVNDSLGHHAGDELLKRIAQRLVSCVDPDDMVARLGGDEFAVVVSWAGDHSRPLTLADRIHSALASAVDLGSQETRVSASVGIAYSADLTDTTELLRNADAAMYRAKAAGKHRSVVFQASMHASMLERYELLNQLDRAIENREITILIQPLFGFDGRLRGGEALARWNHPDRGVILPAAFIPLAEESGTITKITRLALTEACRAIRHNVVDRVSINISPADLSQPHFAGMVDEVLRYWGVPSEALTLEITESQFIEHADAVHAFKKLREVGVRLALDDFGTGYSSLAALRDLPINQLKIAKPFIDDLEFNPSAVKFVELIVGLARNLDMEVVAEGIERESQVEILASLGCNLGQGYYFAHPLTIEEFGAVCMPDGATPKSRRTPAHV